MPTRSPKRPKNSQGTKSLADYAKEHRQHRSRAACWLCNIPERDEVHAAYALGVGQKTIRNWLAEECGYNGEATYGRINNHLQKHYGESNGS